MVCQVENRMKIGLFAPEKMSYLVCHEERRVEN